MTIPIRPGPWSFLQQAGEAAGGFMGGRLEAQQRNRAQALEGLMAFAQLAKLGFADPGGFASPGIAAQAQAAGVPVPPGGFNPVPVVENIRARTVAETVQNPGTSPTARNLTLGLPTGGDVAQADLTEALAAAQKDLIPGLNEAQKRALFKILPADVASKLEVAQGTQAELGDDNELQNLADQAVLGSGGDVAKGQAMIAADPRAPKDRMAPRHFAMAAFKYKQWWEEAQTKYLGSKREARLMAGQEQEQLSRMLIANQQVMTSTANELAKLAPEITEQLFAQAGMQGPLAEAAREKISRYRNLQKQVDEFREDNKKLQQVFQTRYGVDINKTGGAPGTSPPTGPKREPGESDAAFWERAKAAGMTSEQATKWILENK